MKVFKSLFYLFLLQLTLLGFPMGLQAQVDPSIEWKEIETEDAHWIFDARQQDLAEYYIMQFQRAKQEVAPFLEEAPPKMTVVLVDNTDLANGSATVTPQPVITLFPVQPSYYSSIGEFRNFVHELLVHEYTHIRNMTPVHGWINPFRYIFGSIAHPNGLLPRWYTEGLAVYTESKISKTGGRLNSQYVQGLSRALTLENKWHEYPLSDLNDNHPDWLGASRAYLFGGILWEGITRQYGDQQIEKFNQSHSRRIPYFLNGVPEHHIGKSYDWSLAEAYQFWQLQSSLQINKVLEEPSLMGAMLKFEDNTTFRSPEISSDGQWLTFIGDDQDGSGHVYGIVRHPQHGFRGAKPKRLIKNSQTVHVAWHPAATGFVYEKLNIRDQYHRFYDLYFYDLKTEKSESLTESARAHHACFSSQGDTLYYFSNSNNNSKKIWSMNWESKKTEELYQGGIAYDLRSLTCGDDGLLYFTEQTPGDSPRLYSFDPTTKAKALFLENWVVHKVTQSPKGLLITSPQSGIDNMYLVDAEKNVKAITNSPTRVIDGQIDPFDSGLYHAQLTANGPQLFYLSGAQWESFPDTPPQVENFLSFAKASPESATPNTQPETPTEHETTDFSPWRYLYPNYWVPFIYLVDGGTIYQAMTGAGDPLGINNLSLVGQWDTLTKQPGISASYINNSLPVTLGVAASDIYNFFYANSSVLHFTNGTFLAAKRFAFLNNTQMLFRWNYSGLDFNGTYTVRQGPQAEVSYRNVTNRRSGISPTAGWRFELGHKNYLADFGNVSYDETYTHIGSYWSSFTPKNHVFYLGVNASYAPKLNNAFFATSTLAGPFLNPQITNTSFLQRGYPTGIFIAKNIINTNAEYRFPMVSLFSGWTVPPVFLKNLQGALVFDATTLDGRYSDSSIQGSRFTDIGRWFTGYGLELESNVNVGFHVPMTFTLGLYYGEEQQSYGGFTTFFNVRL